MVLFLYSCFIVRILTKKNKISSAADAMLKELVGRKEEQDTTEPTVATTTSSSATAAVAAIKSSQQQQEQDQEEVEVVEEASGGGTKRITKGLILKSGRLRLPDKLMEYLNQKVVPDTLWWLADGESFALNTDNVQEKLLNKYFQKTKLSSFLRSLNRW